VQFRNVAGHVYFLGERLVANCALVRLFLGVRPHVVKELEEVVKYALARLLGLWIYVPALYYAMVWLLVMAAHQVEEPEVLTLTHRLGVPNEQWVQIVPVNH